MNKYEPSESSATDVEFGVLGFVIQHAQLMVVGMGKAGLFFPALDTLTSVEHLKKHFDSIFKILP
jgi:hypothetical protein